MHVTENITIIGAGLSGLTAAVTAAQAGATVTVLEKSRDIGGRARTTDHEGYLLNFGAHALYADGPAIRRLRQLKIPVAGHKPPAAGSLMYGGGLTALPSTATGVLRCAALSAGDRWKLTGLLVGLKRELRATPEDMVLSEWLDRRAPGSPQLRATLEMFARLVTYCNAPERLNARLVLAQLVSGAAGVVYLDGGWQSLVDGLRSAALDAGVTIRTGAGASDLSTIQADAVVVSTGMQAARQLLPESGWSASTPAQAAALDIALRRLPNPKHRFVLGLHRPLYLSVHTPYGRLAPEGGAVVHVMKYLAPTERAGDRAELEGFMDQCLPGWREEVVAARFLPRIAAVSSMTSPHRRPDVPDSGRPGIFISGDWVGRQGWLADAAIASGTLAAERAVAWARTEQARLPFRAPVRLVG